MDRAPAGGALAPRVIVSKLTEIRTRPKASDEGGGKVRRSWCGGYCSRPPYRLHMLKAMEATELADDALMARIAHGDRVAFRMLTGRLYGPALRVAVKVLGDRAEAEDAVQAALVKLWQAASRFDAQRGSVEGWFRRVVVNACIDRRRTIKAVAPIEAAADAASPDA